MSSVKPRQQNTTTFEIVTLEGPVRVAYRKRGREWYATALEFDIVGVGSTKAQALRELQELFRDYVSEFLATPGMTHFFNPSPAEDWETKNQEHFRVAFVVSLKATPATRPKPLESRVSDIAQLRPVRERIKSVQLQPVG
jgi:hypothetical protein